MTLTILLIVLALGPAAGFLSFRQSAAFEREAALVEFEEQLLIQVSHVRESMLTIVESLYSLRAFFDSSNEVTREEFAKFTNGMRVRQPTLFAAEWIPRVPAEQREAHEAAARADGFPDYVIREFGTDGELRPAGPREEYFPVYFVEPFHRNERAVGLDLGSEPLRRATLTRAMSAEEVALSEAVPLVQDESNGPGILAVLSICKGQELPVLGFVLIVCRVEDLIQNSLLTNPIADPTMMRIRITDTGTGSTPTVIYESEGFQDDLDAEICTAATDIALGGQVWRFSGCPTSSFLARHRTRGPLWFGLGALLIWELFFGSLFLLVRWSRDRSRLDQARADETVLMLSSAVEQTADTVFITNREGTIEYVNRAFEKMFGFSRADALGRTPRILKSGQHGLEYYEKLWRTVLTGDVFRAATVNRKKNGELIHIEQTVTPMHDSAGDLTRFVSVCKDMTEKRRSAVQRAELRVAALIQKRLYPATAPRVKGLDLAGAVFSAEATCGDYFDYIPCLDGGLAVAIGDVSGHGLGPALIMAETRAFLRPLLQTHGELDLVYRTLHQNLAEDLPTDRFVTLLTAKFDRDATSMRYVSAGHPPGNVIGGDGRLKLSMDPTGPALGITDKGEYTMSSPIALESGDVILLLTDGVTEARAPDGSFFGEERAIQVVRDLRRGPARTIVERLFAAVRAFTRSERRPDDITIVVVKVDPLHQPD